MSLHKVRTERKGQLRLTGVSCVAPPLAVPASVPTSPFGDYFGLPLPYPCAISKMGRTSRASFILLILAIILAILFPSVNADYVSRFKSFLKAKLKPESKHSLSKVAN